MRVWCASGAVGKLMGVVVDRGTGLAVGLVVRVRGDVEAEATWPTAPLWPLLPVAGQTMLLPPAWATNVEKTEGAFPPLGGEARLILDASASQVAHSLVLRPDADLLAGILGRAGRQPGHLAAHGRGTGQRARWHGHVARHRAHHASSPLRRAGCLACAGGAGRAQ